MRQIDGDTELLHALHHLTAEGREPAVRDAVRASRHLVVEEVGEPHHAIAVREQDVHVLEPAVERVQPLDGKQRAHLHGVAAPTPRERHERVT